MRIHRYVCIGPLLCNCAPDLGAEPTPAAPTTQAPAESGAPKASIRRLTHADGSSFEKFDFTDADLHISSIQFGTNQRDANHGQATSKPSERSRRLTHECRKRGLPQPAAATGSGPR